MDTFLLQAFSGLVEAMFLFLLASGLSLIFGVSRVINISHGAFYTLGAYGLFSATGPSSPSILHFAVVVILGALAIGLVGAVVEMAIIRRVYRGGMLLIALVTFGILECVEEIVRIFWGPDITAVPKPRGLEGALIVGGHELPTYSLALMAVGAMIALVVWLAVERTRFGLLIRAAAIDREMLGVLGVDVPRILTLTFGLGTALAGLAGLLAAPMVSISPTMGSEIIIQAFAVVVIGGLGSLPGSLLGAILVGECDAFGVLFMPQNTLVLLYALMAMVLVIRPAGLLGTQRA